MKYRKGIRSWENSSHGHSNSPSKRYDGGSIGDGAIDTPKVEDQAITVSVSAYTAGTMTLPGDSTWRVLQSAAIDASGNPIHIFFSNEASIKAATGTSGSEFVRVKRGKSQIPGNTTEWQMVAFDYDPPTGVGLDHIVTGLSLVDTPPSSGTYVYKVEGQAKIPADNIEIENRSLFLIETKK